MGALSFASKHANGGYVDHLGTSTTVDAHTDVTIHHETGSFAAGRYDDPAGSQYGMDATIYQLSEEGVPMSVFAADTLPSDGIYSSSSVNATAAATVCLPGSTASMLMRTWSPAAATTVATSRS